MEIAGLLPFAVAAGVLLCARSRSGSMRTALVHSAVLFLGIVAIGSEVLSFFGWLRPTPIRIWWIGCTAGAAFAVFRTSCLQIRMPAFPRAPAYLLVYVVLTLTLAVALASPPNTWDGMTYHMPRVVHWLENGSLAFYRTAITRQNEMPPLGEEVILHLQALTMGDRFANLPSWTFFALSLVAINVIAQEVALPDTWAAFCTALAAMTPMPIFQATSCKNDSLTSFLILAFVYLLLRLAKDWSLSTAMAAGAALGLGLYCKGTVLIIAGAAGLAFVMLYVVWRHSDERIDRKTATTRVAVLLAVAALIPLPHIARDLISPPFAGDNAAWTSSLRNEDFAPTAIASNLLRDASLHLTAPHPKWNAWLHARLSELLGPELNNPRTTFLGKSFHLRFAEHEDYAGNPLQLLLITGTVVVLFARWRYISRAHRFLALSVAVGIFGFAVALKWQEWLSRLQSPLFLLGCVAVGIAASHIASAQSGPRRMAIQSTILGLASAAAVPALLFNPSRPLLGARGHTLASEQRTELYFENRPELYADYSAVDRLFRRSQLNGASIALACGEDDWEYPLYVFSGEIHGQPAYRFHHLDKTKPEQVFLAMGSQRALLEADPRIAIAYHGEYLGVYVPK